MMICLLFILLLLPTWGWAKERTMEPPGVDFMICGTDWSNGRNWNNCVVEPLLLQRYVACYQRMQAAMHGMDRFVQGTILNPRRGKVIWRDGAQEDFNAAKHDWDTTMRDCVEAR